MNNLNSIDFDKVKNIIAGFSPIEETKEFILNEQIDYNPLIINRKLSETKEFFNYIVNNHSLSFDGIVNPCELLEKTKKGVVLTSNEILDIYVFHNHANRIKNEVFKSDLSLIKEYTDSIVVEDKILDLIERSIDNNGNIKRDATFEIEKIFDAIDENDSRITDFCNEFIKDNSEYLQEKNVYERNNRFVFLFKNQYKNKMDGYDYGSSGSGLATYIEPSSLVIFNNKKNKLEEDKYEVINKLLKYLSDAISNYADNYINDFEILKNISAVYAKAYFGVSNMGCIGELGDNLYLQNVKHPLIDSYKVVSNTYTLNKDKSGIVISGSNTGGKTVSLKVIGLSICMTYLGIPVIASKVTVPLFDNILIDIDNNQSINDSLSTFSAHISSINEILNVATNKSLILIDELISGTDPKEAEAISLSIIKKILSIGSKLICTTHYGLIKQFAYDREDIMLSSVEFDKNSLMPTYKYIENSIGDSNAFDIANRYLDDKNIINDAKTIVKENRSEEEKRFEDLTKKMREVESLKNDLTVRVSEYEENNRKLEDRIRSFDASIVGRKNQIISEFNDELDEIKEKLLEKINRAVDKKDFNKISNEIKAIDKINDETINIHEFKIGERVRVKDINNPGYIVSINGDIINVDINGLTIKTNKNSLTLLPIVEKTIKKYPDKKIYVASSELVVVGKRVEDALISVDSFLDQARLGNLKKVKIIHGVGTLALKNAIWDRLAKVEYVIKYYSADFYDGGLAATIVELG